MNAARAEALIRDLSSIHTRHSLTEGYREAMDRLETRLGEVPGLEVLRESLTLPAGPRVPVEHPTEQIHATLPGTDPETKAILLGAHLDSVRLETIRGGGPLDLRSPGANDNLSGVAAMVEALHLLASLPRRPARIEFIAFAGEELGLLGSRHLAALSDPDQIRAVLTADMIGNPDDEMGRTCRDSVRIFSSPGAGRELARRMEFDARGSDLELKFVDREDRVGRGGDHSPFARRGIPAIRLTETLEHYGRQHSDQDLPEHVCFQTVAQVGGILGCTAAGLSLAGDPPPAELAPGQALSARIRIDSDSRTEVWIRPTDQVCWTEKRVGEPGEEVLLEGISPDDFFIGVSAPGGVPTVLNP